VTDVEIVRVALNGFTKPWTSFNECICAREKFPDFGRLWDDSIQEETRREALGGPQRMVMGRTLHLPVKQGGARRRSG
jgi:hypothetical protein